jgi:tartrate dehydratase beta subunit/fumarate hydratase class I family protein
VNGVEVYSWWDKYRNQLFEKNIRGVLGDTQVNSEITDTLEKHPEQFWFFINGITIICDEAIKNMVGGATTELGQFTHQSFFLAPIHGCPLKFPLFNCSESS